MIRKLLPPVLVAGVGLGAIGTGLHGYEAYRAADLAHTIEHDLAKQGFEAEAVHARVKRAAFFLGGKGDGGGYMRPVTIDWQVDGGCDIQLTNTPPSSDTEDPEHPFFLEHTPKGWSVQIVGKVVTNGSVYMPDLADLQARAFEACSRLEKSA